MQRNRTVQRSRRAAAPLIVLLLMLLASPVLLLAGAFWLSGKTHRFGPWDPRVVLLVWGTSVQHLGLVDPESGSVAYAARGQDGNSPARVHLTYRSQALPAVVLDTYRRRCAALGLEPTDRASENGARSLACTGSNGDYIGIGAERSDPATVVTLGGWLF